MNLRQASITFVLLISLALAGCAVFVGSRSGQGKALQRIFLGSSIIEVSAQTRETDSGQHISEFTCAPVIMICRQWGPILQCRCDL